MNGENIEIKRGGQAVRTYKIYALRHTTTCYNVAVKGKCNGCFHQPANLIDF